MFRFFFFLPLIGGAAVSELLRRIGTRTTTSSAKRVTRFF